MSFASRAISSSRVARRLAPRSRHFSTISAKVVQFDRIGAPTEVLKVASQEVPKDLSSNQVLVKMAAAPINPADLNIVEGTYGIRATVPAVGGNEGAGVVIHVGSGVKNLAVNDHVLVGRPGLGTWRTHGVFDERDLFKVPKDIPLPTAAVMAVNPCTAYRLLADFQNLKAGDVVIQNGANSMVGLAVIQIAKERNIKTINVIRNRPEFPETVDMLKKLGGDMVVSEDYLLTPPFKRILNDLPKPKLALNCVGGNSATEIARLLADKGTLVTYGGMSKKPVTLPTSLFIFKQIQATGFWMTKWAAEHSAEERTKMLNDLFQMVRNDKLKLFVETWQLERFAEALKKSQGYMRNRKIVLQMN